MSLTASLKRVILRKQPAWKKPEFVKAAHYFSDGWALNFWQVVDRRRLGAELEQLVEDGFNTIILLLPWRGMQSDHLYPSYCEFYFQQLDKVMSAAEKTGLSVILRVSYSHQIVDGGAPGAFALTQDLLQDADTQAAWQHYLSTVYRAARRHRCLIGAFLSWEEFWGALSSLQQRGEHARQYLLETTGFAAYLQSQGVSDMAAIPRQDEPGHRYYHGFINQRVQDMYRLAVAAFPGLSMEFRVDKDPLQTEAELQWLANDAYSELQGLRYSYWAPFMGADNSGEQLSAAAALDLLSYMLQQVSLEGERPQHVVDQFNFVDDTPQSRKTNARIAPAEIDAFLDGAGPLLREYSRGYGIWAPRDYRQNMLYNPRFLMHLAGWRAPAGQVRCRRKHAGLYLGKAAVLRQVLPAPLAALHPQLLFKAFRFEITLDKANPAAEIEVRLNKCPWQRLQVQDDGLRLQGKLPAHYGQVWEAGIDLEIRNSGPGLQLHTIWLYQQIYSGGIRTEHGAAGPHLEAIQRLNARL